MIYSVINPFGVKIGYVLDEFYISLAQSKWLFPSIDSEKYIYGAITRSYSLICLNSTVKKLKTLNVDNYKEFETLCVKDDLTFNKVCFIPCTYQDFGWWRQNRIWRLSGCFCYKCLSEGVHIGYILLDAELYSAKSLTVVMLETVERHKGYGSLIVNELKSHGLRLSGIATIEAEGFWKKHGAVLQEYNKFTI